MPWPRSPSSTMSWPAISARSTCGMTVSAKPCRPGHGSLPVAQPREQVVAELLAQGLELVAALAELAEGAGCGVPVLLDRFSHVLHARPVRQRRVRSKSAPTTSEKQGSTRRSGEGCGHASHAVAPRRAGRPVAGSAGWAHRPVPVEVPTGGGPALAERDAFIEQLRELAWQHRDVSPELSTSSSTRSPPDTAACPAARTPEDPHAVHHRHQHQSRSRRQGRPRRRRRRRGPARGAGLRAPDHRVHRARPGRPALQRRRLHPASLPGLRLELLAPARGTAPATSTTPTRPRSATTSSARWATASRSPS